jgi:hypothetical protein
MVEGRLDRKASTATGYAWLVWEKDRLGSCELVWEIDRLYMQLEQGNSKTNLHGHKVW